MAKNLVIVESPSKSRTIEKYLGKDYHVVSSKGHIRDLATTGKFGLGVDVENNFEANYIPLSNKKQVIKDSKKHVKEASHISSSPSPSLTLTLALALAPALNLTLTLTLNLALALALHQGEH